MNGTLTQWLNGAFGDIRERNGIRTWALPMVDRTSTQPMNSAGLVISAGGATTAKIGSSDFYAMVQGTLVKVAASTVLPALTGITAAQNSFVLACFFVDAAGVVTVLGGTPGTTLAKASAPVNGWPAFPQGKAMIGFLIITNTGGAFTGGTTPLDTATTVYINATGDFDPTVLVQ